MVSPRYSPNGLTHYRISPYLLFHKLQKLHRMLEKKKKIKIFQFYSSKLATNLNEQWIWLGIISCNYLIKMFPKFQFIIHMLKYIEISNFPNIFRINKTWNSVLAYSTSLYNTDLSVMTWLMKYYEKI